MAQTYFVKITPYALDQMQEITRYISKTLQAPDTARKWLVRMSKELASLNTFPERYGLTEEEPWRSRGVHKYIVGNHIAYYWIDDAHSTVWIIAVVYARSDRRKQLSQIDME